MTLTVMDVRIVKMTDITDYSREVRALMADPDAMADAVAILNPMLIAKLMHHKEVGADVITREMAGILKQMVIDGYGDEEQLHLSLVED